MRHQVKLTEVDVKMLKEKDLTAKESRKKSLSALDISHNDQSIEIAFFYQILPGIAFSDTQVFTKWKL